MEQIGTMQQTISSLTQLVDDLTQQLKNRSKREDDLLIQMHVLSQRERDSSIQLKTLSKREVDLKNEVNTLSQQNRAMVLHSEDLSCKLQECQRQLEQSKADISQLNETFASRELELAKYPLLRYTLIIIIVDCSTVQGHVGKSEKAASK